MYYQLASIGFVSTVLPYKKLTCMVMFVPLIFYKASVHGIGSSLKESYNAAIVKNDASHTIGCSGALCLWGSNDCVCQ